MQIQIISPEHVLFKGEADSVAVPGKNGSFQMLNNHAPIVSSLQPGKIEIHAHDREKYEVDSESGRVELSPANDRVIHIHTDGGVVELNQNKLIILVS